MRDELWYEFVSMKLDPLYDWSHDFMTLQSKGFFDRFGNFEVKKKAKKGTKLSINNSIIFLFIAIIIIIILLMIFWLMSNIDV